MIFAVLAQSTATRERVSNDVRIPSSGCYTRHVQGPVRTKEPVPANAYLQALPLTRVSRSSMQSQCTQPVELGLWISYRQDKDKAGLYFHGTCYWVLAQPAWSNMFRCPSCQGVSFLIGTWTYSRRRTMRLSILSQICWRLLATCVAKTAVHSGWI